MKLKFKHQKFQADAAKAVVDVFKGQPYLKPTYLMDMGKGDYQFSIGGNDFTGWSNHKLVPGLNNQIILENIRKIQRANGIEPSKKLEGMYNLTIEMETGTGKTYTYIKTMYELNKHYSWSKFIVVVPSIAVREGVYKSFQITQDHFAEEYGKKIRFFIYDSKRLTEIDKFASDNNINVMIINSQAFNATGKDARRIHMKLDEFRSRRPIDILAQTNPIIIIDEPQSVEGKKTKEGLKDFNPLMTLRYSATHREKYNMIYRLDAMDAYNKRLVKKIQVKGITQNGNIASDSFLYLEGINLSKEAPTATLQFDIKTKSGIKKKTKKVEEGDNIYVLSGEMEEYKEGYTVKTIDGRDESIEFLNGIKLYAGDVIGDINEEALRRIQIRETILSHIESERKLFYKGIKVLSLFFIDEVAKYKQYDSSGETYNGIYAEMFEEEYKDIVRNLQIQMGEDNYIKYLNEIDEKDTHEGYFSIDKKGKMIDSKLKGTKGEKYCDDVDAYDLIMKNKELLLEINPKKSPVRFIFSHSALKEGWDNPNVFQICTLKQSGSEIRKRQEVGRGLRLCVNQDGERQDTSVLGEEVHDINKLTVIASESYENFAKGLQSEMSEAITDRPRKVNTELFVDKVIKDNNGNEQVVDRDLAGKINFAMIMNGYVDNEGALTDKYYEDKKNNEIKVADEVADSKDSIIEIINSIFNTNVMKPENARDNNVELEIEEEKLYSKEFQALWKKINKKSYYKVDFDTEELVKKSIIAIDAKLNVPKIFFKVEIGTMEEIKSKETLQNGDAFIRENVNIYRSGSHIVRSQVPYDLVGDIVKETGLTRKAVVMILTGIRKDTFEQFKDNPEEFILRVSKLINEEKATAIVQHISYDLLDESYDIDLFTEPTIKGKLDVNVRKSKKHLYDHVVYDSKNEKEFSEELDVSNEVAVYVKLPSGFYISTPVGKYNPDWAIAFREGSVKHIYFVAETKGSMHSMDLREIEKSKIHCATEHFKAISGEDVKYHVVDSYERLLELVQ
ncbi:TPA: type III restriction-modification system endonuclease [Clostridium perfringens]|uniref:type III restriction-modification system endonuclease n=1 Tax=Clostridium perfringens TaxID=1502 RepID=UPI001CAECE2A|nr:DEAD/DEAH box helicase family protein [Clostridium perfringens]MCX0359004.1 DEAD/DEAH box helicase family protein [Clostridium perfringens]MCX0408042.1 DEAD/DEAH box helicase family protein [Clostridium perfringens]MCX0418085.1 DEAD/DEAH box helicase family protein [Clostridium perfringens]MDU3553320.1 DEAD/DEAH box helicase family protein [Clostridium perfringens]MDU6691639.1 DEAD/DEAH box helicase family protein [Clostridium perfringens]